ncbi:hypothetical protein CH305_09105 [Rhodococcus sp. 15-649-2-2]|uniref:ABC transporter substrate-binding protein n=1 Tax=Rhodococcus sp. 15-649-2-2 TaxID=2023140 RepID=UPI000B9B44C6|nr:ABC transporter substrate-binding protein [Rhodococcus sp. 15-649-2-2]OZE82686.1 hypothetical protein CH305_09105 [Rhodococcus sp. 15-649-2-2]
MTITLPCAVPAPSVEAATRREFLTLLGAAGLLTACSATGSAENSAPTTRSFTGAFGEVDYPLSPERLLAIYATDTDMALTLGLSVAAAYATSSGGAFPPYQASRLEGVKSLATYPPNFEEIAELGPDLILHTSASYSGAEEYDTLSAIAPVFSLPEEFSDGSGWRNQLRLIADAFDRADIADRFISEYDARAAAVAERMSARWNGARFAYVGPMDAGVFYIAQANMQTNQVLHEDLGLAFADAVPPDVESRRSDISYEEIGMLSDADIIVLRVNPVEGGVEPNLAQSAGLIQSPLWQALPAARAGNVFTIDGDLFYGSPLTAQANLDWAEANLL